MAFLVLLAIAAEDLIGSPQRQVLILAHSEYPSVFALLGTTSFIAHHCTIHQQAFSFTNCPLQIFLSTGTTKITTIHHNDNY
jgi:hypothetical protein